MSVTSSTSLSSPITPHVSQLFGMCVPGAIPASAGEPVLWLSADDLPPLVSFDSVTWPSLSTIVVPSENATDLRGLRSAASCSVKLEDVVVEDRRAADRQERSAPIEMFVERTMYFERERGARDDVQCQP